MIYRLLSGRHSRTEDGVRVSYAPGDPIELTEAEAKSAGARVEPWGDAPLPIVRPLTPPPVAMPTAIGEALAEIDAHTAKVEALKSKTVAQVVELLATLTTAAEVGEIADLEEAGHARKGVLKHCVERLEELEGAAS